jgi:hypothetical protein
MRPYSTLPKNFDSIVDVEGYFLNEQIDLREQQIADTEIVDYNVDAIKRFQKYKYKDSTDEFIKEKTIPFDQTFDLGGDYLLEETEESENPFFEPTMMNYNNPLSIQKFPLAALWDNDNGSLSNGIKPRRCIYENRTPFLNPAITTFWAFDGVQQQGYFPTCFMEAEIQYAGLTIKNTMSYKFWGKLFIEKILRQSGNGILDALFLLDYIDYDSINFRYDYVVYECGNPVIRRLEEVKDFQHGKHIATPLKCY